VGEHERCRCKKDLVDGERILVISAFINWGDNDERAGWAGEKSFCSFACMGEWATEMAASHDGKVV
jgi:hypothetical protein